VKKIEKPGSTPGAKKPAGRETAAPRVKPPRVPPAKKASKKAPGRTTPATSEAKPVATPKPKEVVYIYNPGDRPDPFRPFYIESRRGETILECRGVPPGPLTEKEITQFSLVAVVGGGKQTIAMVQDTEGKGYVLRLGTYVGMKCGKVATIGPDGVIIEEPYRDLLGRKQTRKVSLGFRASEGVGA
jgi:Tfp pilus assembly protein PilP